jgi:hypothetical protein
MGSSAAGQGLGGGAARTFGKHTYTAAKSNHNTTTTTTTLANATATTKVSPARSSGVTPGNFYLYPSSFLHDYSTNFILPRPKLALTAS